MFSVEDVSSLPAQDVTDIKGWLNAALLECYSPVAPATRYPPWTETYWSEFLKAPAAATLGLTAGSTAVTGFVFEAKYIGSFVKIGDRLLRLANVSAGPVYNLLQAWDGDTGSYEATVYYNAVALPARLAHLMDFPSMPGIGQLYPMPGPEAEVAVRGDPAFDFASGRRRLPLNFQRRNFRQSLEQDVGDPYYYHVDEGSITPTFAPTKRFHVYPLPARAVTLEGRYNVLPVPLSSDGDVPALPATPDLVQTCLLPLAREQLANNAHGRRFSGDPRGIATEATRARQLLSKLSPVQRSSGSAIRPKAGW